MITARLIPVEVPRHVPCGTCSDWGTVPDPDRPGQYKPCPENCAAARRAAGKR